MEKNSKKYTSKENNKIKDVIDNIKNGMKSDKVRKALMTGVGVTCLAAGVCLQNPIATKIGNDMVKDVAVDSVVNLGKDFISNTNSKISEIINLSKEKIKMSDIENQENILNREMELNKEDMDIKM